VTRRVTQADLLAHLREHCVEGVEDPFERIQSCIDGVGQDLASAADDVNAYRSRTAASDLEDAAMLMGEAIGFALGYKVPPGEAHHWRAIRLLVLYLQANVPALARQASQLELLRTYRHRVKYEGAEAPMAQTKLYFDLMKSVYETLKGEPLRLVSERQKRSG
jgi:hypothetical protein